MAASVSEDIERFHRWSRTYERSPGQFFVAGIVLATIGQKPDAAGA